MLALILHLRFLDRKRALKLCFSLCFSLYFGFKCSLFQLGTKECPECYGNELCRFFQNHQIQLTWFSCFLSIIHPKLTKSVFHGVFNDTAVVVKRKKVRRMETEDRFNEVGLVKDAVENVVSCASVRDVKFLFDQIRDGIENKKLWLDLGTSIEPLLLMYFETLLWPFPKYHGACGDLTVVEYKGEPLTNFLSSVFEKRTALAASLLNLAKLFTFGHSSLAFYFTDYSFDNLVVDSSGNVFLIDLDNVIISNKTAVEGNSSNRSIHTSEIFDDNNYAFSPFDICQHYISDHNYFSVCKYLLSHPEGGLLTDIPQEFEKSRELSWLLDECSQPKVMTDRFSAGQNLQALLEEITNDLTSH